jgi:hypothetical protein
MPTSGRDSPTARAKNFSRFDRRKRSVAGKLARDVLRGKPRNRPLDQSQESGVASPRNQNQPLKARSFQSPLPEQADPKDSLWKRRGSAAMEVVA